VSLTTMLEQHRRLEVLRALAADDDRSLNDAVLRQWVRARLDKVDRDQLRADLLWLEKSNLVRIERLAGADLWMVHLRELGEDVAGGRRFPGIATPEEA
jgi:hypothetical protein